MKATSFRAACALLFLAFAAIAPGHAQTVSAAKLALADRYVDLIDFDASFKTRFDLITRQLRNGAAGDVIAYLRDGLDVAKIRQQVVETAAEIYTEEELNTLVAFYGTPVGKSILAKQPQFAAALSVPIQQQIKDLMAKYRRPSAVPQRG